MSDHTNADDWAFDREEEANDGSIEESICLAPKITDGTITREMKEDIKDSYLGSFNSLHGEQCVYAGFL